MKFIIDTSSLLSLARYYHPFDNNSILKSFLSQQVSNDSLIIIDKVAEQSKLVARKIISTTYPFLFNKSVICNTEAIPPNEYFFKKLTTDFLEPTIARKLKKDEAERAIDNFVNDADGRLVIYGLHLKDKEDENVIIITDETSSSNDRKAIKKIPVLCEIVNLKCLNSVEFLERHSATIKISISSNT